MQIVNIPIKDLKTYEGNSRDYSKSVSSVMESIKRYGCNVPIAVNPDNCIIAGHTRLEALTRLGATVAPCVVLTMGEELENEYRVIDNKTSELAKWDLPALALELRANKKDKDRVSNTLADFGMEVPSVNTGGEASEVKQEQYDKTVENQHQHYKDKVAKKNAAVKDYTCCSCGMEFSV